MESRTEVTLKLQYSKDTARYCRYLVATEGNIKGAIYFPKGKDIPARVVLEVEVHREER